MEIHDGRSGALPSVMGPNTRRRIAERTPPAEAQTSNSAASITTEGVDGHREKALRIASVEQVELDHIMELSATGHVLKKWQDTQASEEKHR